MFYRIIFASFTTYKTTLVLHDTNNVMRNKRKKSVQLTSPFVPVTEVLEGFFFFKPSSQIILLHVFLFVCASVRHKYCAHVIIRGEYQPETTAYCYWQKKPWDIKTKKKKTPKKVGSAGDERMEMRGKKESWGEKQKGFITKQKKRGEQSVNRRAGELTGEERRADNP